MPFSGRTQYGPGQAAGRALSRKPAPAHAHFRQRRYWLLTSSADQNGNRFALDQLCDHFLEFIPGFYPENIWRELADY